MENQASIVEPTIQHSPDAFSRRTPEPIVIPPRPKLSAAEAKALLDHVQSFFAGQPSFEDEYFRDREPDKW